MFNRTHGRELLLTLGDTLDKLRIPFFLIQGTALGAVRDGDFVPTEKDIDIGVLIEHLAPNVGDIARELLRSNIEVMTWNRHRPFNFCHTIVAKVDGAKADIVGFLPWEGNRFVTTPDDPVAVPEPYCIVHPAELLETYEKVELFGRKWNIPRPIEQYLWREYGPDWKTPKEDHISRTRIYHYLKKARVNVDGFQY